MGTVARDSAVSVTDAVSGTTTRHPAPIAVPDMTLAVDTPIATEDAMTIAERLLRTTLRSVLTFHLSEGEGYRCMSLKGGYALSPCGLVRDRQRSSSCSHRSRNAHITYPVPVLNGRSVTGRDNGP